MDDNIEIFENEDGTFGDQSSKIILYRHAESEANMIWRDKVKFQSQFLSIK